MAGGALHVCATSPQRSTIAARADGRPGSASRVTTTATSFEFNAAASRRSVAGTAAPETSTVSLRCQSADA
ncbi:MAG: hypothetical protein AB7P99_17410 [Vicinamibacterales bacterium]